MKERIMKMKMEVKNNNKSITVYKRLVVDIIMYESIIVSLIIFQSKFLHTWLIRFKPKINEFPWIIELGNHRVDTYIEFLLWYKLLIYSLYVLL